MRSILAHTLEGESLMGGPGGASQSFHSYLFDCPSPTQDYYLTSSCVNCHNPPTHSKSNPILIQEDTKGICLPKPSPCPAEIRWPEHLQSPIKEIKKYPWWIYQNYLSTQMQEKQLALTPKAIESSIVVYLNPGQEISFDGYKVKTQQGSLVFFNPEFAGQGQNFNLILEGKKLIESQSVSGHSDNAFDALLPKSYIQTIEMKDGHPLLNLAVGPLNLLRSKNNPSYIEYDLMDKITPLLPVAFHLITHETLKLDEYEKLSSNEKKNYQRFTVLYSIAVNKKFPEKIRAEDLFQLYQEFQKPESSSSEKKVAQKNPLLDHLVQSLFINIKVLPDKWINENLYIKFNHQKESEGLNFAIRTQGISEINSLESKTKIDLEELFIPHVIDLKNVSGNLEIKIDEQGKTRLSLNNFYSQIGSIDFLKSNLRKIGLVELKEGSIQDGPSISTEKVHYEPGIHIASLEKNTFQFQTNLVIHAKVALPFFGEVEISTQCVGSFQFRKIEIQSENGEKKNSFELIPQTTHFSFLNLETKKSPLQKWFKGELQLSDVNVSSLNNEESNSFEIQLKMNEFSQTNPLSSGLAKI
ncbi:MAG: hypothetical protein JNK65_01495, partial [Deltaproteobacteria bacterium]|nr:hypothetical protein [Deltaproteobacteria bacterium]